MNPGEYLYYLPRDHQAVAILGMAAALIDLVKKPRITKEQELKDRVWQHCERLRTQKQNRELTNDYVSFVGTFYAWYTFIYLKDEKEIDISFSKIRTILKRNPPSAAEAEVRSICTSLFFPENVTLTDFITQYKGTIIMPYKEHGGHCATFIWNLTIRQTQLHTKPDEAIQEAKQMIDSIANIEEA